MKLVNVRRLYACITAATNALSEFTLPNVKLVLAERAVVRVVMWYSLRNMFPCQATALNVHQPCVIGTIDVCGELATVYLLLVTVYDSVS